MDLSGNVWAGLEGVYQRQFTAGKTKDLRAAVNAELAGGVGIELVTAKGFGGGWKISIS